MTTDDIRTLVWKESKELLQQGASRTGSLARLIFPIVFVGIIIPWMWGERFISARVQFMLVLFYMILVVTIVMTVDSFAGERERHTLETLLSTRLSDDAILFGKLIASVAYAWLLIIVSLILGLVTVNVRHGWHGKLLLFSASYTLTLLVWTFLASVLLSALAVLLSLHASTVRQASQTMGFGAMILAFAGIFGFQALPALWQRRLMEMLLPSNLLQTKIIVTLAMVVLNVAVLSLARVRFRRAKLILD